MRKIPKISVVIPCYNEEMWVASVISSLLTCQTVSEIIGVDDGSKDKTLKVLNQFKDKIRIISYKKNRGKGYAMAEGVKRAKGEIIVFCDGHHLNIKDRTIIALATPLIKNQADAVLGTTITVITDPIFWKLTGFRAYRKNDLLPLLAALSKTRFGAEVFLNEKFKGKRVKVLWIKGLKHLTKLDKMPVSLALSDTLKEAKEITQTLAKINGLDYQKIKDIFDPQKIKSVKILKQKIRQIRNKEILSLLKKYLFSYLNISS